MIKEVSESVDKEKTFEIYRDRILKFLKISYGNEIAEYNRLFNIKLLDFPIARKALLIILLVLTIVCCNQIDEVPLLLPSAAGGQNPRTLLFTNALLIICKRTPLQGSDICTDPPQLLLLSVYRPTGPRGAALAIISFCNLQRCDTRHPRYIHGVRK